MTQRQDALRYILQQMGEPLYKDLHCRPGYQDVAGSPHAAEVRRVYQALGGIQDLLPLNLGTWDLQLKSAVVELDEERHFNQYRLLTLLSPLYSLLPDFALEEYRQYCRDYEGKCLAAASYGRYWSSEGSVKQFGKSSAPGNLEGLGSPRWKQRAFYDFVKDLSPLLIGLRVVRVPIWDRVDDGTLVDTLLKHHSKRPSTTPSVSSVTYLRRLLDRASKGVTGATYKG